MDINTRTLNMIMDHIQNVKNELKEENIDNIKKQINTTIEYLEKQIMKGRYLEKENRINKLNRFIELEEILFENGYTVEQIEKIENFDVDNCIYNIDKELKYKFGNK